MKTVCILWLLVAGCVFGSHGKIRPLKEFPVSPHDSSLAILEKKLSELEEKINPPRKSPKPIQKKLDRHDSIGVVDWPDDRVYRFIFSYQKLDTNGNPMEPFIRFQFEQFNGDTSIGYVNLNERLDRVESDYWIENDTLFVNIPYLRKFNPVPAGEYLYLWRFRIRLEDFFDTKKNSDWVSSMKTLNLIKSDRWVGVPQKPTLIDVH